MTIREGHDRDATLFAVREALKRLLWPLPPGGIDGRGWPLGRDVREREIEVEISRVAGVLEVGGINLFRRADGEHGPEWRLLPRNAADPTQTLTLEAVAAARAALGAGRRRPHRAKARPAISARCPIRSPTPMRSPCRSRPRSADGCQRPALLAARRCRALAVARAHGVARRVPARCASRPNGGSPLPWIPLAFAAANTALEAIPRARRHSRRRSRAGTAAPAPSSCAATCPGTRCWLPLPEAPSDLCVGAERRPVLALSDRVHLHDLRGRWADEAVRLDGFAPWRIEADAGGAVGARARRPARAADRACRSALTTPQRDDYAPGVFRPGPRELLRRRRCVCSTAVSWPAGERPIALAAHPGSGLAVLSWFDDGEARLRRLDADSGRLTEPLVLTDARYAYALAWLDAGPHRRAHAGQARRASLRRD